MKVEAKVVLYRVLMQIKCISQKQHVDKHDTMKGEISLLEMISDGNSRFQKDMFLCVIFLCTVAPRQYLAFNTHLEI